MIDWITANLDYSAAPAVCQMLRNKSDRIVRFSPVTGEVDWESFAWQSVRSDSHVIAMRVTGNGVSIQGSPARVFGNGCNVFGSGSAASEDLPGCLVQMIKTASKAADVLLPTDLKKWNVTRVDVTRSILLDDLTAVRAALKVLRDCEGGRYRTSQQAGDTVYWSHKSRIKAGKAYAKGPHLEYQRKRGNGPNYKLEEIEQANRLLRLELRLGAQYWRERAGIHWTEATSDHLGKEWENYFLRMLGDVEVNEVNISERIIKSADTEGQGRAALGFWLLIQSVGWETARDSYSRATYYRHLKILRRAGLGDSDISSGRVVEFRRPLLDARIVSSWDDLKAA